MWIPLIDRFVLNRRVHTYEKISPSSWLGETLTVEALPSGKRNACTVLYFHGRGDDLGTLLSKNVLKRIADASGCRVVAFEYPGYGWDRPSKLSIEGSISAGARVYETLCQESPVMVYGYSVGAGIALEAVRRFSRPPACVFLEGAFRTLLSCAYANRKPLSKVLRALNIDALEVHRRLPGVPTYFVHGLDDEMCSAAEAQEMARSVGTFEESLWLKGRGHYDAWRDPSYRDFIGDRVEKLLKPKRAS